MDFMADVLVSRRKFRVFTLIDEYNGEVLALEVDTSLGSKRVIRELNRKLLTRDKPQRIQVANGQEFTPTELTLWCKNNGITTHYIQPEKPTKNAFIDRSRQKHITTDYAQFPLAPLLFTQPSIDCIN